MYLGNACRRHSNRPYKCSGKNPEDCHSERARDIEATSHDIRPRLQYTYSAVFTSEEDFA